MYEGFREFVVVIATKGVAWPVDVVARSVEDAEGTAKVLMKILLRRQPPSTS